MRKSLKLISVQPARVEPIEQTPIQSKIAAYVAEVAVDFGDAVKKDQPLIKLKAPELDAELVQKQALLEQAKAELVQAESSVKAADAAIATAKSKVTQSQAAIDRSQADVGLRESEHQRIEELATNGSVNRQLLDEAQQKLRAAEASSPKHRRRENPRRRRWCRLRQRQPVPLPTSPRPRPACASPRRTSPRWRRCDRI